jgi:hypothetical protein
LGIDVLPLAHEQMAHHLVAFGERQGFQMIEGRLFLQGMSIGSGDLDAIQLGQVIGLGVVVAATDQDVVAAHGLPPCRSARSDTP